MDWNEILLTIVKGVATALITVIGGYVVLGVNKLFALLSGKTNDATLKGILSKVQELIVDAVDSTEQTLVKTAKETNNWDDVKKGEAFQKALNDILTSLNDKAKSTIITEYGNLDTWLSNKIEAYIKSLH
jgi:hypothetical protein